MSTPKRPLVAEHEKPLSERVSTNVTISYKEEFESRHNESIQEKADLEQDALFGQNNSVLILDGWKIIKKNIESDKKAVKDYNEVLREADIPFAIRGHHTNDIGPVTYIYCGAYMYAIDDEKKYKYVGRYHSSDWKTLVGFENLKEHGFPPRMDLSNIRYQRIKIKTKFTDHIIIPYSLFMSAHIRGLFNGQQIYRLL